jgi:hypothetical protein
MPIPERTVLRCEGVRPLSRLIRSSTVVSRTARRAPFFAVFGAVRGVRRRTAARRVGVGVVGAAVRAPERRVGISLSAQIPSARARRTSQLATTAREEEDGGE